MARHEHPASRPLPTAFVIRLFGAACLLCLTAHSWAVPSSSSGPVPKWISATGRGDRALLAWVRDDRAAAVRIYRTTPGPAEFKLVGESREGAFADADVLPGGIYRYRLTAVDASGKEGAPSSEVTVRIVADQQPPTPPVWLGYLSTSRGVQLKWGEQEGADVIAYNIYRKVPPETTFGLLGSAMGTSFTDSGVEPGKPVVYAVTALASSFLETPLSEELPVVYARYPSEGAPASKWRPRRTRLVALVDGGDQPFFRPADVAVGPVSGNVYVADSGRNRIFVFNPHGVFVRSIGAAAGDPSAFRRVIGLGVDREETVYAVDAGRGAVFAFGSQGGVGRRLPLASRGRREAGLVDCAAADDGGLLVVDNSNDLVLRADRSGAVSAWGAGGVGPGEVSAPTFCATDAEGRLYIADSLNARVQVFTSRGEFVRAFGLSRRGFGGMLRPKGVAVAPNGEIYVADSWQNSVQVFAPTGEHLAVLTDEKGVPLDLGSPNGIALGAGNKIYIAERLSARLQIREIIDEAR